MERVQRAERGRSLRSSRKVRGQVLGCKAVREACRGSVRFHTDLRDRDAPIMWGGKPGSICHFAFPLVLQCFWEKESIHRPAPVQNFSLPKKMGATEESFSVVDMVFLVFIGFLYPPPAWKVFL